MATMRWCWTTWRQEFFTQDQMALLKRFVAERGGGFMMMKNGGADSFHEGQYDRTPVGDFLPVLH